MRPFAFIALLLATTLVAAQELKPADSSRVDPILEKWEKSMSAVTALEADVTRSEIDEVSKSSQTYKGKLRWLRPGFAFLHLENETDADKFETHIYANKHLYVYQPAAKMIIDYELPLRFLWFEFHPEDHIVCRLFRSMKVSEAKEQFEWTLAKEDEHYSYFFLAPKDAKVRQEFTKARFVLWKETAMPRLIEVDDGSGTVVKWDFPRIDTSVKFTKADFEPKVPAGWTMEHGSKPVKSQ
ncbi:MAG: TIGR03009 domain-containing protein [Gemmataceae bacterium]